MMSEERVKQDIEISVLTGCLLRCGRIDLMIGEQSRFVSQEYRALDCMVRSRVRLQWQFCCQ